MTAKKKPAAKKLQKGAQPAYVLKVAPPRLTASAKRAPLSAVTIAQLQALAAAGVLPGVSKSMAAGFDIADLLKLFAQYQPLIEMLLPLIQSLFKKTTTPVVVPDEPTPKPAPTPDEIEDDGEPSAALRVAVDFGQSPHWFTRKKSMKENTGRFLGSDGEKLEIWKGSTPSMQGDRWCVDHTPRDAQGKPFLPGQAENATITWEYEALGVGELQLQEEVDFTPVFLVPWKGLDMDSKHEAGLRATMFVNGTAVKTREHTIRVHTRGLDK